MFAVLDLRVISSVGRVFGGSLGAGCAAMRVGGAVVFTFDCALMYVEGASSGATLLRAVRETSGGFEVDAFAGGWGGGSY